MKNAKLLMLCLLACYTSRAQNNSFPRDHKNNNRYWVLGIGNSSQNMYDESISPVRYKGTAMAPSFELIKNSERKYRQFSILPTFNKLTTDRSGGLRPMEVNTTRLALNYRYLVKMREWANNFKLYVGGGASFLFNLKRAEQLDNSQLLYDYTLGIGPVARVEKKLNWRKRDCILSYSLDLPLLSHVARPYYLNRIEFIDPKNDFLGDIFKNSSLATVNRNLRITSGLAITYPLFNRNALRLGYTWDFYRLKTINTVYAAEHLISIAFLSNY